MAIPCTCQLSPSKVNPRGCPPSPRLGVETWVLTLRAARQFQAAHKSLNQMQKDVSVSNFVEKRSNPSIRFYSGFPTPLRLDAMVRRVRMVFVGKGGFSLHFSGPYE